MESKITWKGGMAFTGTADDGYLIPLDSKKVVGGHEMGFRPMQLFAIALIGCTGMDVISILQKKKQDVKEFIVSAELEKAEEHPKVFTKIVITYKVIGKNIDEKAVERAVELSETKYCPGQAMLNKTADITHKIIIEEAD